MPKWTPELDAILLHGVFEECNISFSKALCTKIAQRVKDAGIECTAKAVENRLYSWKKKSTSGNTGLNSATSTPAKTPATPNTPGPRTKAKPEDNSTPAPSVRKRKAGAMKTPSYAESQSEDDGDLEDLYVPKSKVKTEPAAEASIIEEPIVREV